MNTGFLVVTEKAPRVLNVNERPGGIVTRYDRQLEFTITSDVETISDPNATNVLLERLPASKAPFLALQDQKCQVQKNSDAPVTIESTDISYSSAAVQGDTFKIILSGVFDPSLIGNNVNYLVYQAVDAPKFTETLGKSILNGLSVAACLNYLYPFIDNVGGLFTTGSVSSVFNTFVGSFKQAQSYTQEDIVLTAGNPVTITHNLGEKLVVLESYSGGLSQELDTVLVDSNSLTIESATNITVSIIIKA